MAESVHDSSGHSPGGQRWGGVKGRGKEKEEQEAGPGRPGQADPKLGPQVPQRTHAHPPDPHSLQDVFWAVHDERTH